PMRPPPGESDPEGSVQWREPRARMTVNVDGQLLAECQLYDRLVLATSEKSDRAAHDRCDESQERPEHHPILIAVGIEWEPESRAMVDLSSADERDRPSLNTSQINVDE